MERNIATAIVLVVVLGVVVLAAAGLKILLSRLDELASRPLSRKGWGALRVKWPAAIRLGGRPDPSETSELASLQEQLVCLMRQRCRVSRAGTLLVPTMIAIQCDAKDHDILQESRSVVERELADEVRRWNPDATPPKLIIYCTNTARQGVLQLASADFGAKTVELRKPGNTRGTQQGGPLAKTREYEATTARLVRSTGQTWPLQAQRTTIGREADIRVADAKVSREHVALHRVDDRWYLEDLASLNGTAINHKAVRGRINLHDGDEIQLGRTVLTFRTGGRSR